MDYFGAGIWERLNVTTVCCIKTCRNSAKEYIQLGNQVAVKKNIDLRCFNLRRLADYRC